MTTSNNRNIAIVINNQGGQILPSETFFLAHINQLTQPTVPLVGIPGHRIAINTENKATYPSRYITPLALRWLARKAGLSSIAAQDRRAVVRFLHQHEISAVVAEYGPTAVSVMDACKDASVPLIAHFHGFDAYTNEILAQYKEKYLALFDQAAAIVAVSEHMKEQLISIGAKESKVYVNACGADLPSGLIANPLTSQMRFLMVGRLVEKKAPFLAVMAFSHVVKAFPEAKLDIVGDGPLYNVCQQMTTALGLNSHVVFHGALSHEKVFELLKESRCFIQHSVCTPNNDHEGTPVGVLEAMGMGLPVASTRHGGIRDIIDDGVTGSLVDEYDVEGMAKAMLCYAENPALAQRVGEQARSAVISNWTSEMSITRLQHIIDKVSL